MCLPPTRPRAQLNAWRAHAAHSLSPHEASHAIPATLFFRTNDLSGHMWGWGASALWGAHYRAQPRPFQPTGGRAGLSSGSQGRSDLGGVRQGPGCPWTVAGSGKARSVSPRGRSWQPDVTAASCFLPCAVESEVESEPSGLGSTSQPAQWSLDRAPPGQGHLRAWAAAHPTPSAHGTRETFPPGPARRRG